MPAGYGGLTWSNFNYTIGSSLPNSGYPAGTVSLPDAAYNPYGNPASIISTGQVNFVSAYLTAAWNDNLQVQVKGYSGGTLVYSNSYILSATAPTLINFNYLGVNEIDFISSGGTPHPGYSGSGTHFVMDNVVIGGSVVSIASITPTNSGNFVNGAWTGNITVLNRATGAMLVADDGNGHTGLSNPFDVVPANMAPVILAQPTNQVAIVGGTATFTVAADGTPPLSYQWNFNGTNIAGATNTFLTLTNVQFNQAGNYAVLVTNVYGSILSSNAMLTVNPIPPCDPAPSGLVAWWPGEGNANDVVGGNNGTMMYGAAFTNGEVNQAFNLPGVSPCSRPSTGPEVLVPDSNLWAFGTNSFSIELWANFNIVPNNCGYRRFGHRTG